METTSEIRITQDEVIGPNFSFRIGEEIKINNSNDVKVFKCVDGQNNYERTMKRIWNGEETIIDEIKRLVELREVLPCSIIKFYTHFSVGKEAFYFVTDPYESSNIEKLLMKLNRKGRAISPSKIIDFAMQILDALAFIHSRKIIHRDIKPKNLLIDELGHVILADFKLNTQIDVFSDDVKESLNYLSPELFDNNGYDYTHKIDIWSFGCVLYELITFKKVIDGSSIIQIAPKINQFALANLTLPSDIDTELEFVLKNTLQKDPDDRKEADVLRDQLSSAYEKENKERFCFLLRDMSISSTTSLDRMQSILSTSSGIGSALGSSLLNTASSSTTSSSSHPPHHGSNPGNSAIKDKRNLIKSIQEIQSIGDMYFDEKNYSKAVASYLDELSQKQENEIKPEFLNRIGLTYEFLDDYANAVKFYKTSLALLERENKTNEPNTEIAKCLQNIAIATRNIGEFSEALEYDLRSLDMRIKFYGNISGDHIDIADSYNTCGDAYSSLGEFSSAISYYKKSLEMRRRLAAASSSNHNTHPHIIHNHVNPEMAHLLNCIGVVYDRLGNYEEALDYKLQALRMRTELHRDVIDHKDVASSLNSVGVAYDRLNDYTSAIESYLKSLDMRYRLIKTTNPNDVVDKNIGDLLFNLGVAYENLRNFKLSLDYYQKSLDMRRRIYKDDMNKRQEVDHVDIADSLKSIGNIYSKLGEHEKSLDYMLKCFEIKQRIYLEDHPELAECLDSIGHSYEFIGKHKTALEYFLKSWDMRKNIYASDHLMITNSLVNIADSYVNQCDYTKAIFYYFKCIDMRERLLQNNSSSIADLYDKIALAYSRSNDHQAALGFYNDALKMRQKVFEDDPNQPEIGETHVLIGDVYSNLGEYQLALNSYTQGLNIYRALSEGPNDAMSSLLSRLGDVHSALGSLQSALQFYSESLNMRKMISATSDDRPIVKLLFKLGVVYLSLDEANLAIENLEKSLEMMKRLSGNDEQVQSVDMAECFQYIGDSYMKGYNYRKAQEYYTKSIEIQKKLNEPAIQIASCLNKLGICALEMDDANGALDYFNQSMSLLKSSLGDPCDHVEIARTLNYIGVAHQYRGDNKDAFENKWRSFEMRKRLHGKRDHPELAESLDAIGTAYDALESYKNALEYKTAGLSMRRRLYMEEENNLEVADSLTNIGKTYELSGNLKMASEHYYQSLIMKRKLLGEEHPSIFKLHNLLAHVELANNPHSKDKESKETKEHKFPIPKPKIFKKPHFLKKPL